MESNLLFMQQLNLSPDHPMHELMDLYVKAQNATREYTEFIKKKSGGGPANKKPRGQVTRLKKMNSTSKKLNKYLNAVLKGGTSPLTPVTLTSVTPVAPSEVTLENSKEKEVLSEQITKRQTEIDNLKKEQTKYKNEKTKQEKEIERLKGLGENTQAAETARDEAESNDDLITKQIISKKVELSTEKEKLENLLAVKDNIQTVEMTRTPEDQQKISEIEIENLETQLENTKSDAETVFEKIKKVDTDIGRLMTDTNDRKKLSDLAKNTRNELGTVKRNLEDKKLEIEKSYAQLEDALKIAKKAAEEYKSKADDVITLAGFMTDQKTQAELFSLETAKNKLTETENNFINAKNAIAAHETKFNEKKEEAKKIIEESESKQETLYNILENETDLPVVSEESKPVSPENPEPNVSADSKPVVSADSKPVAPENSKPVVSEKKEVVKKVQVSASKEPSSSPWIPSMTPPSSSENANADTPVSVLVAGGALLTVTSIGAMLFFR